MRVVELTPAQLCQLAAGTHYVCSACGGFFEKGWSEGEAVAESRELFGSVPHDMLAVICDPCFERGKARGALDGKLA